MRPGTTDSNYDYDRTKHRGRVGKTQRKHQSKNPIGQTQKKENWYDEECEKMTKVKKQGRIK